MADRRKGSWEEYAAKLLTKVPVVVDDRSNQTIQVVVCQRKEDAVLVTPGANEAFCDVCGHVVYVNPDSIRMAPSARLVCLFCLQRERAPTGIVVSSRAVIQGMALGLAKRGRGSR